MSAIPATKDTFAARGVGGGQLPCASPKSFPLDEAAEARRATRVGEQFGKVAPGVVQYTTDSQFRDLWPRPDLAPRDRGLVTVTALIANAQVPQMPYHPGRAMDNGLTQAQAAEVMTHLAFYVGQPNVFFALSIAKDVFEKRPRQPLTNPIQLTSKLNMNFYGLRPAGGGAALSRRWSSTPKQKVRL